MFHRNATSTADGRLRLDLPCRTRPIAHAAAEPCVSRQRLPQWVNRYLRDGEQQGLRVT